MLVQQDIWDKTPILTGQNYGSFGSKVWHFWVVNRRVMQCHPLNGEKFDYCYGAKFSFWWYNIF